MKQAAQMFQALSHPVRLQVLDYLSQNGETRVQDLHRLTSVTQSCLSQHLSVLRKAGLVETRKQSQWVFYAVSQAGFQAAHSSLDRFTA